VGGLGMARDDASDAWPGWVPALTLWAELSMKVPV
jgi:hypothetical protein